MSVASPSPREISHLVVRLAQRTRNRRPALAFQFFSQTTRSQRFTEFGCAPGAVQISENGILPVVAELRTVVRTVAEGGLVDLSVLGVPFSLYDPAHRFSSFSRPATVRMNKLDRG
jgi:hypothetical protein